MQNKSKISIAIPTYNRAGFLYSLLNNIVPRAEELNGLVEICISNNGSTDNTREVVADFKKKYPNLINYSENKTNLGFDANILKVMEMSRGDFTWLFGDDDMVVGDGIKKVLDFIRDYCNENTGVIMFGHKSSVIDNKTGEEMVYFDTKEEDKPQVYKINLKNIVGVRLGNSFISVLLFNSNFIKKILQEEKQIIKEATGKHYIHTFVYQLMLLKYSELEIIRFNESIINADKQYCKFYVEDSFRVFYVAIKKLNDLLLNSKYTGGFYKKEIIGEQRGLVKNAIKEMGIIKAFGVFDYFSFFGCLKSFFLLATPADALLLSSFFIIFSAMPPVILREVYIIFIKIKYKKDWKRVLLYTVTNSGGADNSNSVRRLVF